MQARRRVLIIRFSSFGDIILTTPVIRCVKEQLDAEVHYLVKARYKAALENNHYIDRIITFENNVAEALEFLRAQDYDWIADLHHNLRSLKVKRALRRPGAAFPKLNVEKWFMTTFKLNKLPDVHIVDRYFETVKALGVVNDGLGLDIFPGEEDAVDIDKITAGRMLPGSFVAMAIGAGVPTKNLTDEQWLTLVKSSAFPVILLGGPADKVRGEWLASQSENCINLAGTLSLMGSASVIAQAIGLVTPDTGLMHVAAAMHIPVLSVWGNTIPEFGMTPYYPAGMNVFEKRFEVKQLSCRPCSKIGFAKCPRGHFRCMKDQPLAEIALSIENLNKKPA